MTTSALRRAGFGVAVLWFSALLSSVPLQAQVAEPDRQPARQAPIEPSRTIHTDDRSAQETRDKLRELLNQYPPSLPEVLKLDPSLLTNQTYLATYPRLSAFLAQHPEVAHNPSFFVGEVWADRYAPPNPRHEAIEMWKGTMVGLAAMIVFVTVTMVLSWLVRTLIDYRRWLRLSKVQTEVHTKLLDRFSSNEDLATYLQSSPGRRFLEAAPIPMDAGPRSIGAPLGRILWSIQAGLVLALGGVGLQYASAGIVDEAKQPLYAMGVLGLMFGIGFVLSAIVSYVLSQRLGLLETKPVAGETTPPPHTPERA
jgi:hypothetical protein